MSTVRPQLLISVRNADEALAALQGGADIVDVKEPLNGSLGRASSGTIGEIGRALCRARKESGFANCELSLALGEVTEWLREGDALAAELQPVLQQTSPRFLKLGLSELDRSEVHDADWVSAWRSVRDRLAGLHRWVAVAYADHDRAAAPDAFAVCAVAVEAGCEVLLIDTYMKDGSSLLDWLSMEQLRILRVTTRTAGLSLALAGRVAAEHLPMLRTLNPDIIAVRGAVCTDGNRVETICTARVQSFRAAMFP